MGRKITMTGKNALYIEHRGVNATPDNDREIRMEGDGAVYQEYAYGQAGHQTQQQEKPSYAKNEEELKLLKAAPEVVKVEKPEPIDWVKVTNDFELSRIRDVVETLGKDNEEKKAIVKAIYDAEVGTGNISRIPYSVDKLLDELYQKYDEEEENNLLGSLGFGSYVLEKYDIDSGGKKQTISQTIINPDGSEHITRQFLDTDGNRILHQMKNSEKDDAGLRLSREYFASSVCDDDSLSLLLIRILREYILPKISSKAKHTNYTWGHLYQTLDVLGLALHFEADKDKARVLYSVYEMNGVNLNTIHCAIKNKTLPKGNYTEWDEKNTDRAICSRIAEWLKPVMDSKSVAEVKTTINF